ncbi:Acyl-CoA thioester hydrolase YbgC [Planctomycetes bacterium Poly30]|uniref:Acyl-CoA thioester hydrolase YbgC n=1 Tax=Saltatorellus ferox TaxID=2528018 RepID=A0A518EXH6_9BACT|nr:Acyl-CoA thioester hydrolase YbgC [Planctomycetes bacterium Poly30]
MQSASPSDPRSRPREAAERPQSFTHPATVRYAETDQMGVCHHANFLLYLEDARTAMMAARAVPYGELEKTGIGLPVRQVQVRYKSPAFYEDRLLVEVWIERMRSASVTFGYEIRREDKEAVTVLATAEIELACMDMATRRPRIFPKELRAAFSAD